MRYQQFVSSDAHCPHCLAPLGQEHKDCALIQNAISDYKTDDVDVSLRSGVEKVDGAYWVEAWVFVYSEEE